MKTRHPDNHAAADVCAAHSSAAQRLIVCYGNTLYLEGIAQLLDSLQDSFLVHCDPAAPDSPVRIRSLHPDVLIVDLLAITADDVLDLLRDLPGVPLIALDLRRNEVLLLQSHREGTPELADFVELVRVASVRAGRFRNG